MISQHLHSGDFAHFVLVFSILSDPLLFQLYFKAIEVFISYFFLFLLFCKKTKKK